MSMINEELRYKLDEVEKLIQEVEKRLKTYKGLEPGNIRVATSHGCKQYYFRRDGKDKEEYISIIEKEKIHLIAQRDYEEKVYKALMSMKNRLKKFIDGYDPDAIYNIYERMCPVRKELISPIVPTEKMVIEEWMENNKGCANTFGEATDFKTLHGEYVRSKSEKILADYFYTNHIPYQYEPRFELHDFRNKYPDFVLFNVRKRKTIYWEHLGRVGELDYATKNFVKIMDYEQNGLILGDNLIITLETLERPLDIKMVEEKVRLFLM